ncbi:MAG: hypothetical protein LBF24_00010 [Puniceicoccales bacterium]|nr:hypothetical protein [Puniceicoccales bacterium]
MMATVSRFSTLFYMLRWSILDFPLRRLPQDSLAFACDCVRRICAFEAVPQLFFLSTATAVLAIL